MDGLTLQTEFLLSCSNDQLSEHIGSIRKRLAAQEQETLVIGLTTKSISKGYARLHELQDVSLSIDLACKIGVRTPAIQRIVKTDDGYECIFERVHGRDLMHSWAGLGWFTTIRLGLQLRGMVHRMRTQTSPTAGSLGTGIARTFWLEDAYGIPPRPSPGLIVSLVNFWYNLGTFRQEARKSKEAHRSSCEGPITPQTLVFTHHDLAPRNLMIDHAGDLVIVDWDFSGYYPPFFEYAGMYNFHPPQDWSWMATLRWKFFAWLATGSYSKEKGVLLEAQRKTIRFRAARRFNIKAGITPSTKPVDD
ncbi:hypothetical protein F4778DRAFT_685670 [Xylariomycetidae sp. FL2044]|nr:hypothetical protein F4778DRAFT_685670 [Xylariomycetidae sp. FL2044]